MINSKIFKNVLSAAETLVAVEILTGKSDMEIAQTLNLSLKTIRSHNQAIYRKTKCRNRAQFLIEYTERNTLERLGDLEGKVNQFLSDAADREARLKYQIQSYKKHYRSRLDIINAWYAIAYRSDTPQSKTVLNDLISELYPPNAKQLSTISNISGSKSYCK